MKKKYLFIIITIILTFFNLFPKSKKMPKYFIEQGWPEQYFKLILEQDFLNHLKKEYPDNTGKWRDLVENIIIDKLDKAFREGIAKWESNDKTKCFAEKIKNSFGKIAALQVTLKMDDHVILNGQKKLATGRSRKMGPGIFAGYIELGNKVGSILNENYFDPPCLEGVLLHELLHALPEIYDENIAQSCSHVAFSCAPLDTNYKDSDCDCKDEKRHRKRKSRIKGCINDEDNFYSPGRETPDDNFSFYSGDFLMVNDNINALIYKNAFFKEMDALIGGLYFEGSSSPEKLSNISNVMVIPSSAFFGQSNNSTLRVMLKEYVQNADSLIIFTQQYGKDIENLIFSEGSNVEHCYGYREDQSCLKNSVYIAETGMHPILSSTTTGILDVGIDGYFTVNSSSNTTVLLRRKINDEPGLLYYKYGAGTIYLTSLFTDYAYSRSMASVQELKLVKNILRHAMDPDADIPMFNLEENPNPTINLNIQVTNHSETPAAKAKISVYTIENTLVYETEAAVNLNKGESADIPITFTLPELESKNYGIGFSVYQLKDADYNLTRLELFLYG